METIQELRAEKRRLIAEIKRVTADIAAGNRPSPRQLLRQLIIESFTETAIPQ